MRVAALVLAATCLDPQGCRPEWKAREATTYIVKYGASERIVVATRYERDPKSWSVDFYCGSTQLGTLQAREIIHDESLLLIR